MENRIHSKGKGGTELGRGAEHLGKADCLVRCAKCTEGSSRNMCPHQSFKLHHYPARQGAGASLSPGVLLLNSVPGTGRSWLHLTFSAVLPSTTAINDIVLSQIPIHTGMYKRHGPIISRQTHTMLEEIMFLFQKWEQSEETEDLSRAPLIFPYIY